MGAACHYRLGVAVCAPRFDLRVFVDWYTRQNPCPHTGRARLGHDRAWVLLGRHTLPGHGQAGLGETRNSYATAATNLGQLAATGRSSTLPTDTASTPQTYES